MRKILFLNFLVLIISQGFAQNQNYLLDNAKDEYSRKHFKGAADFYLQYFEKTNDNKVLVDIGRTYAFLGNNTLSVEWYEKAINQNIDFSNEDILQLSEVYLSNNQIIKSREYIGKYNGPSLDRKENLIQALENYDDFISDRENFEIKRLNINSDKSDFGLTAFADGFIFASNRSYQRNTSNEEEYNFFDLYFTKRTNETDFTAPEKFEHSFDSKGNDGPITFFQNESKAIISRNNYHRGIRGVTHRGKNEIELYEIDRNSKGDWGDLERLPFDSDDFSSFHPTFSSDGSFMIFASNRPGGKGGVDLYKVDYNNGDWGIPSNLGSEINTSGNEMFPFIQGDSVLYFSSNGQPGMGGLDLFSVNLKGQKAVQNLGSPFNSNQDDFAITILDEKNKIVSSNRGLDIGQDDFFLVTKVKEVVKTTRTIATSSESKEELPIQLPVSTLSYELWLIENLKNSVQGLAYSPGTLLEINYNGNTLDIINQGESIVHEAVAPLSLIETIKASVQVETIEKIEPLFFNFDSYEILESSFTSLNKLKTLLDLNPEIILTIIGYADSRGPQPYNLNLSHQRANAVKQKLIDLNVSYSQLLLKSVGETTPLKECGDNCTNIDFAQERRVEFTINFKD